MKIAIVEDHALYREILRKICSELFPRGDIWEYTRLSDALDASLNVQPNIVILDLQLPDGEGLELILRTRSKLWDTKFLVVSAHCDIYTVYRLQKLNIHGFIDKDTAIISNISSAIRALQEGQRFLSKRYRDAALACIMQRKVFFNILSDRELDVLKFIAEGADDEEIARSCSITPMTAKTHRGSILRKLNIASTAKLIAFALEKRVVLQIRTVDTFSNVQV